MELLNDKIDIKDYLKENPDKYDNNYFMLSAQLIIAFSGTVADYFAIIPYFIRKKLIKKSKVSSKEIETLELDDKVNECKR